MPNLPDVVAHPAVLAFCSSVNLVYQFWIHWDRLFGSFTAETERPVYGLTKNINTFNPIKVATHEYVAIVNDIKAAGSRRERAGRVFRGPGRQPAPVRPEPAEETVGA